MKKFIAGNCVRLTRDNIITGVGGSPYKHLSIVWCSVKILTNKDIQRGFYRVTTPTGIIQVIPLDFVEHCFPEVGYKYRDSSMRGKTVKPVSPSKFEAIYNDDDLLLNSYTTYIVFKGQTIKVIGWLLHNNIYFSGMNGEYYKAKTYITKDGYRVGYGATVSKRRRKVMDQENNHE